MTTYHGLTRMQERTGFNESTARRQINRALERGKTAEFFSSWERKFLEQEARNGCKALAYNGFCYIVNADGYCVTAYPLPVWFGKKKRFDGKERIRNPKAYAKYHVERKQAGPIS